jgi:hypothetical protein
VEMEQGEVETEQRRYWVMVAELKVDLSASLIVATFSVLAISKDEVECSLVTVMFAVVVKVAEAVAGEAAKFVEAVDDWREMVWSAKEQLKSRHLEWSGESDSEQV